MIIVNKNILINIRQETLKSNIRHKSLVIGWHEFQHSLDVVFLSLTETTTPFGCWSIRHLIRFCITATSSQDELDDCHFRPNFVLYLKILGLFCSNRRLCFGFLKAFHWQGFFSYKNIFHSNFYLNIMDIKLRKGNLPTGLLPSYFTLDRREVMRVVMG